MTKERILLVFKDINQMYNNARMYDGLSQMLDELVEDSKKSVEPERKGRECASCKHSNNGECAYTEECHECMWESKYERKPGKWVHMVGFWECDQCHAEYTDMPTCMGKVIYEYCPMCGAKMEVDNGLDK